MIHNSNYRKWMYFLLACGLTSYANAANQIIINASNYQPGDILIIKNEGKTLNYSPNQINRANIQASSQICYRPKSTNNRITLRISHKNSSSIKYSTLSANSCVELSPWYANLYAIVSNMSAKFFVPASSATGTYTKGTRGLNVDIDNETTQPSKKQTFCLAGAEGFQYLQPKLYSQLYIPIHDKNDGFIAQIFYSDTGELIQKAQVNNNAIYFTDIDILANRNYSVKLLDTSNHPVNSQQLNITPYDITSQRTTRSFQIPFYQKNHTLSESQNEVVYNVNNFDRSGSNYSYLYLNALNSLLDVYHKLNEEDKDVTIKFIQDYLEYYCQK